MISHEKLVATITHFKGSLQERKNSITGVHEPPMQVILQEKNIYNFLRRKKNNFIACKAIMSLRVIRGEREKENFSDEKGQQKNIVQEDGV